MCCFTEKEGWRIPLVDNVGKNKPYRNYEASIRNSQVLVSKKKILPSEMSVELADE